MEIRKIPVATLENWEHNPRTIDDEHFSKLKKYIAKYNGSLTPLLVDSRDCRTVLGGNMRLRAFRELGITEVDCNIVPIVSDAQALEVALLDNNQFGTYDKGELINLLTQYEDIEAPDFEIDLDPIPMSDLLALIGGGDGGEDDFDEDVDEVESIAKLGDIYQLGNHRLMCGDSTSIDDVEKLMNGNKADMVFTDPPYGVNYASKNEFLNNQDKGNHIQVDIENDTMTLDETSEFIYKCFVNLRLSLAEKSSYYITAPQGGDPLMMMMMMMQKADIPLRHMLIWVKNNHVLGRTDYNYKHEPILYGWINTHNFYGKGEWKFSTWEIDKPLKNDLHPTMKPIALMVNAILNSTLKGNIVLDLFGGSGSTLIACEQTNRKCYMMELDEHYVSVIIERYINFTGNDVYRLNPDGTKTNWRDIKCEKEK